MANHGDHPIMYQPNGGFLGTASALANQAYDAWDRKQQHDLQQQKMDAGLLGSGYLKDDSGKVVRDPNAQAEYEHTLAEKDPESGQSARARAFVKTSLESSGNKDLAKHITDEMSGYEAKQYLGVAKPNISGEYGVKSKQAGLQLGNQRLDIQKSNQASHVADVFDKDENLKTLTRQQQGIQRGQHTLKTVPVLTPQLFNEIQMDIANAISGGKAAAVSTQNKAEFKSLETEFQDLKQRITNKPQDIGAPEVKDYINSVLSRLDDAYNNNMYARAQQIHKGRSKAYSNNPAALDVLEEKMNSYRPQSKEAEGVLNPGLLHKGALPGKAPLSPEDQQAIEWAKQNPGNSKALQILKLHGM